MTDERECLFDINRINYWEHVLREKELARIYPPEHPRRIKLHAETEKILQQIHNQNKKP